MAAALECLGCSIIMAASSVYMHIADLSGDSEVFEGQPLCMKPSVLGVAVVSILCVVAGPESHCSNPDGAFHFLFLSLALWRFVARAFNRNGARPLLGFSSGLLESFYCFIVSFPLSSLCHCLTQANPFFPPSYSNMRCSVLPPCRDSPLVMRSNVLPPHYNLGVISVLRIIQ